MSRSTVAPGWRRPRKRCVTVARPDADTEFITRRTPFLVFLDCSFTLSVSYDWWSKKKKKKKKKTGIFALLRCNLPPIGSILSILMFFILSFHFDARNSCLNLITPMILAVVGEQGEKLWLRWETGTKMVDGLNGNLTAAQWSLSLWIHFTVKLLCRRKVLTFILRVVGN